MNKTITTQQKGKKPIALIVAWILASLFAIVSTISSYLFFTKEEPKPYEGYKQEYIKSTDCEVFSNTSNFWYFNSGSILLFNNSHDYTFYRISYGTNSENVLRRRYNFTTNVDGQRFLIDYNIGKVKLNMLFYFKTINNTVYEIGGAFECYTKGEDNKITFYSDPQCTKKQSFVLTDASNGDTYIVHLTVNTKYMND